MYLTLLVLVFSLFHCWFISQCRKKDSKHAVFNTFTTYSHSSLLNWIVFLRPGIKGFQSLIFKLTDCKFSSWKYLRILEACEIHLLNLNCITSGNVAEIRSVPFNNGKLKLFEVYFFIFVKFLHLTYWKWPKNSPISWL